jgi:hypothetical protein
MEPLHTVDDQDWRGWASSSSSTSDQSSLGMPLRCPSSSRIVVPLV